MATDYAARLLQVYRSVTPARRLAQVGLGLDAGQLHLLPHASWKSQVPPRHIFDPSRRSGVRLELPAQIQDWSHVQGSEGHIDSVCGIATDHLERGPWQAAEELTVTGWSFVPKLGFDGQVHLALVGMQGGAVIFCPASREVRDDIQVSFRRRCGGPASVPASRCVADGARDATWSRSSTASATVPPSA